MKTKDKEFIREILSSDFNQISNPDFTHDTLEKILESEENKISISSTGDISFLIPWILYASLFILLSFVTLIISWPQIDQANIVTNTIEVISRFLLNPVTISILISFSILYIIDLYLKRISA